MVGRCPPIPGPSRADRPQWNRRPAARLSATAPGTLNANGEERRRAVCGRTACTDRWGARGNQASVGHAARHRAPLAYPTTPTRVRLALVTVRWLFGPPACGPPDRRVVG